MRLLGRVGGQPHLVAPIRVGDVDVTGAGAVAAEDDLRTVGDQDPPWSLAASVTSGALPLPSGWIVQMSKLPDVWSV